MLIGQIRNESFGSYDSGELGVSIRSSLRAVGRKAKKIGKTGVRLAKKGAKYAVMPAAWLVVAPGAWLATKATTPIRNRVHKLRNRRAAKLAWDRRKSKTPNPQEVAEAKSWTKKKLKGQGPHGRVLALFAGAPEYASLGVYEPYSGQLGVEPATATVIAASIPVLIAIMNRVLGSSAASGEAPADPQADATADTSAAKDAAAQAEGAVDVGPVQEAAADAAQAVQEALPPPPGMIRLPGGVTAKKSHLLIVGAVVGGLVLLTLLLPKKS